MFQVLAEDSHEKSSQALFTSKDKSKKLKCRLLQFLFGALRVNLKSFCGIKIRQFSTIFVSHLYILSVY